MALPVIEVSSYLDKFRLPWSHSVPERNTVDAINCYGVPPLSPSAIRSTDSPRQESRHRFGAAAARVITVKHLWGTDGRRPQNLVVRGFYDASDPPPIYLLSLSLVPPFRIRKSSTRLMYYAPSSVTEAEV